MHSRLDYGHAFGPIFPPLNLQLLKTLTKRSSQLSQLQWRYVGRRGRWCSSDPLPLSKESGNHTN